jgi:PQQ-like domain
VNVRAIVAFLSLTLAGFGQQSALGQSTAAAEWPTGSFDPISSFLHPAGVAVADGRVIFVTFDGTIYRFDLE